MATPHSKSSVSREDGKVSPPACLLRENRQIEYDAEDNEAKTEKDKIIKNGGFFVGGREPMIEHFYINYNLDEFRLFNGLQGKEGFQIEIRG